MAQPPVKPSAPGKPSRGGPDTEPDGTGMPRQEMKKLLGRARLKRVSCALAQGPANAGGLGLVLMDRVRPPREVLKTLRTQFPEARTPCWGTASVDMAANPKLVTFNMNKKVPGLSKRLVKTLRGTGISQVAVKVGQAKDE